MDNCWLNFRASGVLAHLSSLPGPFGIGNLGEPARDFINFLHDAGFRYWQICPPGPTGYGDSPYQSFSSFAGNPYFLDLEPLIQNHLLCTQEVGWLEELPDFEVDYGGLYHRFWPLLAQAAERFEAKGGDLFANASFSAFRSANASWLEPFAAFMGLKDFHGGLPWTQWESRFRDFNALDLQKLPEQVLASARTQRFLQFLFFTQWEELRAYARSKNIGIISDLPIYTAMDSADTWQHRQVFRLDKDGRPSHVAGVPPDYFSALGQLWGNPLYDWDFLQRTDYAWWVERLASAFRCCDILRLDHFRAFDSFWEIPADAPDARIGTMQPGPGKPFFDAINRQLPGLRIIAEDLGYITEGVHRLRQQAGLPGMKILQFAYGHDANNVNLPHFYRPESVVYTGTHDNDTVRGWFAHLFGTEAESVRRYYGYTGGSPSAWPLIRAAFACVSRLAVIPLQDLMDLGSDARLNIPGTAQDNWRWRFTSAELHQLRISRLEEIRELHRLYDRDGDSRQREYSEAPAEPH